MTRTRRHTRELQFEAGGRKLRVLEELRIQVFDTPALWVAVSLQPIAIMVDVDGESQAWNMDGRPLAAVPRPFVAPATIEEPS